MTHVASHGLVYSENGRGVTITYTVGEVPAVSS